MIKTVVLAGGYGSRLSEETVRIPKPMVTIGRMPILWHIMKLYAHWGHKDFLIAAGYKAEIIKEFFDRHSVLWTDWTLNLRTGERTMLSQDNLPDWTVSVVDTGLDANTGGRLKRLRHLIGNQTFFATYGDGVADIDISALLAFHRRHGKAATLTAVRPIARFGGLDLDGDRVSVFAEKEQSREGWINGGFFVFEPSVLERISSDDASLEHELLASLAANGDLMAYRHGGFWHPMDTMRDLGHLESLWQRNQAPWKIWRDAE